MTDDGSPDDVPATTEKYPIPPVDLEYALGSDDDDDDEQPD